MKQKRFTDGDRQRSDRRQTWRLLWPKCFKRRTAVLLPQSHTGLTFSSSSEELVQDRERWEPFREGGSRAKRGRSKATARARLRHSSSTPATFYSLWHSASGTSFFCHSFSRSSYSPEWRWPWCSCWIRRYSISPCYRDRPQRYSTEHNKSHIPLVFVISRTVCYCAFRSLEQLLTHLNKPAVILYSQTFVFIHRVWFSY